MVDGPAPVAVEDAASQPASAAAPVAATAPMPAAATISSDAGRASWRRAARHPLAVVGVVAVVLAVVAGGFYGWKLWTVRGLERQFAAERNQLSTAQRQAIEGQAREMLRLSARPLAWAVRAELVRGNVSQVDDYLREFVRERGVNAIALVGPDRKIQLATNRKLETQPADALVSKTILDATDVVIEPAGSTFRMGLPIMGFDRRFGVLVIDYDPTAK